MLLLSLLLIPLLSIVDPFTFESFYLFLLLLVSFLAIDIFTLLNEAFVYLQYLISFVVIVLAVIYIVLAVIYIAVGLTRLTYKWVILFFSCAKRFLKNLTPKAVLINMFIRTILCAVSSILLFLGFSFLEIIVIKLFFFFFCIFIVSLIWYPKIMLYINKLKNRNKPELVIEYLICLVFFSLLFYCLVYLIGVFTYTFFPNIVISFIINNRVPLALNDRVVVCRTGRVWDPNGLYNANDQVPANMPYWDGGYNPETLSRVKSLFFVERASTFYFVILSGKAVDYHTDQYHDVAINLFKWVYPDNARNRTIEYVKTVPAKPWFAKFLSGNQEEELFVDIPAGGSRYGGHRFEAYNPSKLEHLGRSLYNRVLNTETNQSWMNPIGVVPGKYPLEIEFTTHLSSVVNNVNLRPGQRFSSCNYLYDLARGVKTRPGFDANNINTERRSVTQLLVEREHEKRQEAIRVKYKMKTIFNTVNFSGSDTDSNSDID